MTGTAENDVVDSLSEITARETVNPLSNEQALADYPVDRLDASPIDFDSWRSIRHDIK